MKNIKIELEYDGGRYQGWQRLGKGETDNTISGKITEVLKKMSGEDVELHCGSRTEVGVHAYHQIASFKLNKNCTLLEIKQYLNRYLPQDIAILSIEEMPERFHASLNAISRTYIYRIQTGDTPNVFERKYAYYNFKSLNIDAMKEAAGLLTGAHDFLSFSSVKKKKNTEKKLFLLDIYAGTDEVQITMQANDFLHNMARLIVGTLLDIGNGQRTPSCINEIFAGSQSASLPADPKGLFLDAVEYQSPR